MTELQMTELMAKGLLSEMSQEQQIQVQALLVDIDNTMSHYPEEVRAMAFIALELARLR